MVGAGDLGDIVRGQLLVGSVDHAAHVAGIDKQGFALAVAVVALAVAFDHLRLLVLGQKPEADRDLGSVEELARQGNHAVDQVVFDDLAADSPFSTGVGGHGTVGQHETGHAPFRQFGDHVQNPAVVGVASGRHLVSCPARVVAQFVACAPCLQVEGRISHDEVGLEVQVLVPEEGVGGYFAQIAGDAANGQVHLGQFVGGAGLLLPIDGDVPLVALVVLDELH